MRRWGVMSVERVVMNVERMCCRSRWRGNVSIPSLLGRSHQSKRSKARNSTASVPTTITWVPTTRPVIVKSKLTLRSRRTIPKIASRGAVWIHDNGINNDKDDIVSATKVTEEDGDCVLIASCISIRNVLSLQSGTSIDHICTH